MSPDADRPDGAAEDARLAALVVLRGVAGAERIVARRPDGAWLALDEDAGRPLCEERPYCGYPPDRSISRYPLYGQVGGSHAIYLETDHDDMSRNAIYAADLRTGGRISIGDGIAFAPLRPYSVPEWAYALARDGGESFWSLATADGMRLYRSRSPGAALESIAHLPLPAGEHILSSRVFVAGDAVVWSLHSARFEPVFDLFQRNVVVGRDGTARFGPDDLPAGVRACATDPSLGGGVLAFPTFTETCETPTTFLVDTGTGDARALPRTTTPSYPSAVSVDGRRLFSAFEGPTGLRSFVIDTSSGETTTEIPGKVRVTSPTDAALVLTTDSPGVSTRTALYDLDAARETVLSQGAVLGDPPYSDPPYDLLLGPDGERVVALSGELPDACTNVGVRVLFRDGTAPLDLEPPGCSPDRIRHLRLSADGTIVAYLTDLDLVAVDLASGERVRLSTTEVERSFEIGPGFTLDSLR